MTEFWLCFVPLFVAVDAVGLLPLYMGLTQGLEPGRTRPLILQSVGTALGVTLLFLLFGPSLLAFLGITVPDFMIAGGILLLAISLHDLLKGPEPHRRFTPEEVGPVPLGVPLIAGPAVLTTCVLLANTYGKGLTASAASLNIILAGVVFHLAGPLTRILGRSGTRTASRIASLLLAAIAVMLIRKGALEILRTAWG